VEPAPADDTGRTVSALRQNQDPNTGNNANTMINKPTAKDPG